MKRFVLVSAALCVLAAGEPVQPVMLPQDELVRRLDPGKEWLFMPVAEWRRLMAAAERAAPKGRAGAGLASGSVAIACSPSGCTAEADLVATVDAGVAAAVALFIGAPTRLESLSVAGAPGLMVGGSTVLLPGSGRWPLRVRWSQPPPAEADAGWSIDLPLPLAAALDVSVTAPPDWELVGDGLVADGPGRWRLSAGRSRLDAVLRPTGSQARAWGASQILHVDLPAAGGGGTFAWQLASIAGDPPQRLRLRLPPGFTVTSGGEVQADGSVLVASDTVARQQADPEAAKMGNLLSDAEGVHGIVAAGAAIDLPSLDGARWQGGTVGIAVAGPALLPTPSGWLPLPGGATGRRMHAVAAPGQPLQPQAVAAAEGFDLRSAAAVVVGGGTIRATWALELRPVAPLHRLDAVLPAGWRVVAAEVANVDLDLPPEDEVLAQPWPLAIALPKALAPGETLTLLVTLERARADSVELIAPSVAGATRSSTRVLLAADPASEVTVQPPGPAWRLGPAVAGGAALEPVAELLATDAAPPLTLAVRTRPVRLEADATCWLLPRSEDCLVRLDVRLAAAGGAIDTLAIALPAALGDGWKVEAGGASLHDGALAWPKPWSGERLVRLAARLPLSDGAAAAVRPRLESAGRPVPLRLAVAALAGERVDVTATPAGRALEPDELPRWSAPPPGARILAAWRAPADGASGGCTARTPRLHDGPGGFLDRVVLRTQLAPGGGITELSARLAAPGLTALPIALPAGMTLLAARVDGEAAAVRRDGDGRSAILLPGRTQVQLILRFAHPAAPGDLAVGVPGLDLPWLATRWEVAVSPAWRAQPLSGTGAMPLERAEPPVLRRWFGSWGEERLARRADDEEIAPVRVTTRPPPPADPRLLGGAPVMPATRLADEPAPLALHGDRFAGERVGAPAGLGLRLAPVAALDATDRLGRIIGLVVGLGLVGLALRRRISLWRCLAVAAAAGSAVAGLLLAQLAVGPLLGLCETLSVLALAAGALLLVRRVLPSSAPAAMLALLSLGLLGAGETPGVVWMGYARIGSDGVPTGVVVALDRERFAALIAAAGAVAPGEQAPALAIGPGSWSGQWRDGRWTLSGTVPVAAPSAAWGELRLGVPGTVTSLRLLPLAGAPLPPPPVWRMDGETLVLALPPHAQAQVQISASREAPAGRPTVLAFPPGGTVAFDPGPGLVASVEGNVAAGPVGLPSGGAGLSVSVEPPAAAVDSGSLGLSQALKLHHLGDRIAWTAQVAIDSQRQAPARLELLLPPRLDVLAVDGDGLAAWRQRESRLELRWSASGRERARSVVLSGVITGDGAVAPVLALPGAERGSGSVAVVDAGPVRWAMPEGVAGLRRIQPETGERFRLAWDGAVPAALALPYSAAATQLTAASDGLLVVAPGRWRAELVFTLSGSGLADHLRLGVPPPWRVVAAEGAAWLPSEGGGILRAAAALAAGSRLIVRCEAPGGAEGLPRIAVAGDAVAPGRVRWLLAEGGGLRALLSGSAVDADALAADLARAGLRARADERLRNAVELRAGSAAQLSVGAGERRQRLEAAHYLIAGAQTVRWSSRIVVQPEQGALDRVRLRLPEGARLADRRGEGVAEWSEADGWLTARFAAPLTRPTALELAFTLDWGEAAGRERAMIAAFACEPALDRESVALAEDEEAGQLLRRADGLEERQPQAVPLPAGAAPALLAGRAWAATGAAWKLTLERERLDQGLGADAVASLVDVHSAIDPDRRLVSRATWYVINRSRSALDLVLPDGCSLWEVRVGGQPVRARAGAAGHVAVPVVPLRPGEAATRIQVSWAQAAGEGLRPLLPAFPELRVMRALWRFTAPSGSSLVHVDGWEPLPAGDATGARVEVLADELKRLRSTSEESPAVRSRLADQLRLIDQELTDHVAVLEGLGQDAARWTGDVTVQRADVQAKQEMQQRSQSFNVFANDNRNEVREKLSKLSSVAKAQRDRRGGLLLDALTVRWPVLAAGDEAGPDWAPRRQPTAVAGAPELRTIGEGLGAGAAVHTVATTFSLTGIDLLPAQHGEEMTLRADNLNTPLVLRLENGRGGTSAWPVWLLLSLAALALGVALSRRAAPPPAR